jgi:predicted O-linked N-acetylglucosamine transferase (SPINDLY family)
VFPGRAETWVNAGRNHEALGAIRRALDCYLKAIDLRPDLPDAHNNLSAVFTSLGRTVEALAAAEQAIALSPGLATAHLHRGNALKDLGRTDDALRAYDTALTLDPMLAAAWNNLSDALVKAGDNARGLAAAERAYGLSPDDPTVLNTVGTLYALNGRGEDAEALLRRVVGLDPDDAIAWLNLADLVADPAERARCLDEYRRASAVDPDFEPALSGLVFKLNYAAATQPVELLEMARRYGRTLAARIRPNTVWTNTRDPERPLRVGFVSPDFKRHPVAYFLEGMLIAGQGKGVDWVAYSCVDRPDEVTERLRPLCTLWRDVANESDDVLFSTIVDDRIDILIDLAGHTDGNRLPVFARKPAPVQATWLGYVGTTGVEAIDYIIGDPWLFPDGAPAQTVETPWRLPECYMSFTAPDFDLQCGIPPLLANGYPTFGSFNNLNKITDEVLALWGRVLAAVPGARLILRAKQLSIEGERDFMRGRLERAGIDPARVELGGYLASREAGMREYGRIDIALDPFPYTGATTTCEALWMGVPVLTLRGERMISRVGESLNRNAGLADWIADDPDDYVARAVRFARDGASLERLRRSLRQRGAATPLGNPAWFANQFVSALRAMWRQWCSAQ